MRPKTNASPNLLDTAEQGSFKNQMLTNFYEGGGIYIEKVVKGKRAFLEEITNHKLDIFLIEYPV